MGFASLFAARTKRNPKRSRAARRSRPLVLEPLENRQLLAAFTPGNIVVYRVGAAAPNNSALATNGSPVFLDEYTPAGSLVQTIAMPTTLDGLNRPLVANGINAGDGFLTRSADGRYLLLTGYDRALPAASGPLPSQPSSAINRVIGRVDWLGNVVTSMGLTDFTGGIHTVASPDGTRLWMGGANGAIRRANYGVSTSSFVLAAGSDEVHQLHIFNDQLYASTESRVAAVGTGLPTSMSTLSSPPELAHSNPYGFYYADLSAAVPGLDTLYVADEGAGLRKYSLYDGAWTLTGTVGTAADKYRGLTATTEGNTVTLYAIHSGGTTQNGGGHLVKLVDASGYNGVLAASPTIFATAGHQTAFRGIAFAPYTDNNAPILDTSGSPSLTTITQVAVNNQGNTVAEIIASSGGDPITDLDPGALEGIAVIATDDSAGDWQYSLDGGAQWHPLGPVSPTSARLLAADASTRIRLVPNGTFTGVLTEAIRFRAWDQSDGVNGGLMSPSGQTGGDNPFSIAAEAVSIEVLPYTNTPPTITPIADQSADEDGTITVNFVVSDDGDLDALTFTVQSSDETILPESAIVSSGSGANRSVTLTPAPNQAGPVTITITASDGEESSSEAFVLTVSPVNDPPSISAIPDQETDEDTPLPRIEFLVADIEQATGLSVTVTTDNPGLFPADRLLLGGSGINRTLDIHPADHQHGSATITLTVTDDAQASTIVSFLVVVNSINDPPSITPIDDVTGDEDTAIADIAFQIADWETDVDSLAISVTTDNDALFPGQNLTITGTGANRVLHLHPAENKHGSATITITVTDGDGHSTSETFLVTASAVNDIPTISEIADLSAAANASLGPIDFTVSDVESDADTLIITAESSNLLLVPLDRIVISGSGTNRTVEIHPVKNQSGTAIIQLKVSDGHGGEATETFAITVAANVPPMLSEIADQELQEDQPLEGIPISISDLETPAAELQLQIESSNPSLFPPGSLLIIGDGDERTLQLIPAENQFGSAEITLTLTDENDASIARSFTVVVLPVNDPPVATSAVITTSQDSSTPGILPADDVDSSPLSYSLASLPRKGVVTITDASTGAYLYRPYPGQYGPDHFAFQVSDGQAGDLAEVQVVIEPHVGHVDLTSGLLTITGTAGDDVILLARHSNDTIVVVIGAVLFGPYPDPGSMRIVASAGSDQLLVHHLTIPIEFAAPQDDGEGKSSTNFATPLALAVPTNIPPPAPYSLRSKQPRSSQPPPASFIDHSYSPPTSPSDTALLDALLARLDLLASDPSADTTTHTSSTSAAEPADSLDALLDLLSSSQTDN